MQRSRDLCQDRKLTLNRDASVADGRCIRAGLAIGSFGRPDDAGA
jgi:hypothetical protein